MIYGINTSPSVYDQFEAELKEAGSYAALPSRPYFEIDEETFDHFLNILPPHTLDHNSFTMIEPLTHTDTGVVRRRFWHDWGRFFTEVVEIPYLEDMKGEEYA